MNLLESFFFFFFVTMSLCACQSGRGRVDVLPYKSLIWKTWMLCDKISATIGPIVANNILGYLYLLICLLSSDAKLGVGRSVSNFKCIRILLFEWLFLKGHWIDAKVKSKVHTVPCWSGSMEVPSTLRQYFWNNLTVQLNKVLPMCSSPLQVYVAT